MKGLFKFMTSLDCLIPMKLLQETHPNYTILNIGCNKNKQKYLFILMGGQTDRLTLRLTLGK